ncbi:MAG: hypothetical protein RLZZ444_403 [Pseudomonadota bacterium]
MRPLIIDSFAGGGGASTGIEMALGRSPDIAINHNPAALALHAVNHPETLHISENVYRIDPLDYLRGKHIGLAWFSPDCKHFSKAKGGKPVERNIRDLAWIIPGWIERIQKSGGKVDVVIMENVEEWRDWGPLIETDKGLMPCPDRRGQTFEKWCKVIRKLGGKIEWRESRARDYGAPTIRKRLCVIIRFDGKTIVWPEPTHGAPDDPDVIAGRKKPWRTAAEIIDWSIPCPSIFDTAEEIKAKFGVRAKRPLAFNSMARMARGMDRYVVRAKRPFLVNLTHGARLEDVALPFNTITGAQRGEKAVVVPSISRFNSGATGSAIDQPLPTITANSYVMRPGGAAPLGLLAPMISYAQQGGNNRPADEPMHTITASAKDQNQVLAAFVAQNNNDSRRIGGVNPGREIDEPLSTVTATGAQQSVISAFIARQFGTSTGHPADAPLGTITADGMGKSVLVAPFLQKYYGSGVCVGEDEPTPTITVEDRLAHQEAVLAIPPFDESMAPRARQVAHFMREHGLWDDREFVTFDIGGVSVVVVDIGMRMLSARELFNAQGFPSDYEIERGANGERFTTTVQVSCCGNSVSPPWAEAHVAANCGHLVEWREAAE